MTRAWPRDLLSIDDGVEGKSATLALHESAHAVMAAELGYTVLYIDLWPQKTLPGVARTIFSAGKEFTDEDVALISAVSRPATALYWHLLGIMDKNRDILELTVAADESKMRHHCGHDVNLERYIQVIANRWVTTSWHRISALAHSLIRSQGRLEWPHTLPSSSVYAPGFSCGYHHRHHRTEPLGGGG